MYLVILEKIEPSILNDLRYIDVWKRRTWVKEEKVGVVSVMFVSESKELVIKKIEEFEAKYPERYFMVYSVPLDTNLEELNHYPSIAIFQSDLN